MIKTKLIPLSSVLKDIYLLINDESITEDLVMEFAIRGMEHLAVNETYERAVCVIPVLNNQAPYPNGMYGVHAVLGNIFPNQDQTEYLATSTRTLEVNEVDKTFEIVEEATQTTLYKLLNFKSLSLDQPGWFYLDLSNDAWDPSILCQDSVNFNCSCGHWFIPDSSNKRFVTSFDYGYIAVAYYRFPQNGKGQFLIPDHPLVNEALETFVFSKIYQRMWHQSMQGAQQKYYHYLEKWQQLAAAAVGELKMPSLPDYINLDKDNTFFRDYAPTKAYGGWGHERSDLS